MGESISFCSDGNFPELGCSYGFVKIVKVSELQTFERVNFIACKLYLKLKNTGRH